MRANRPIFRRRGQYVAVRPIRLSADHVVKPGEDVSHLKEFHLRNLYRRRRIGFAGDPWTEAMLADQGAFARPEKVDPVKSGPVEPPAEPVEPSAESQEPSEGSDGTEATEDAPKDPAESGEAVDGDQEADPAAQSEAKPVEAPKPVKSGSQYTIEGVDGKFTSGKKAVEAWEAKFKAPAPEDDFLA